MTVTINGSGSITEEITIDGVKVGQGAGNISTNTAVGASALNANTTGAENSALGDSALVANTSGNYNTAVGRVAMQLNTTGSANTVVGRQALNQNTTGSNNTAVGYTALLSNTTASNNTAVGYQAGYSNTVASYNTFIGNAAGYTFNGSGNSQNVFIGHNSGYSSTSNTINTFVGNQSGYTVTTGSGNAFFGYNSGQAMTTGSKNTIIGGYDGNSGGLDIRTSSNNIVLSDGDGTLRMWFTTNAYITMGSGGGTNSVKFNTTTKELTYDTSSARYKDNIRDSIYGLDAVLNLQAKQFEYKKDGRSDVGLIAEDVVSVIPELVGVDSEGRPDSVTYDRMVSVLVKAIQELSAQVTALQAEVNALKGQ